MEVSIRNGHIAMCICVEGAFHSLYPEVAPSVRLQTAKSYRLAGGFGHYTKSAGPGTSQSLKGLLYGSSLCNIIYDILLQNSLAHIPIAQLSSFSGVQPKAPNS